LPERNFEFLISVEQYEKGIIPSFTELYNFLNLIPKDILIRCIIPEQHILKSLISSIHHL